MKVNVISCWSGEFFGILDLRDSTVVLNAFPIESKDAIPHPAKWVEVPIDLDLEAAVKHALEQVAGGARRQGMDFVYSPLVYVNKCTLHTR